MEIVWAFIGNRMHGYIIVCFHTMSAKYMDSCKISSIELSKSITSKALPYYDWHFSQCMHVDSISHWALSLAFHMQWEGQTMFIYSLVYFPFFQSPRVRHLVRVITPVWTHQLVVYVTPDWRTSSIRTVMTVCCVGIPLWKLQIDLRTWIQKFHLRLLYYYFPIWCILARRQCLTRTFVIVCELCLTQQ